MFDKFEMVVRYATHPVCLLGNVETSDFELVDLDAELLSEDAQRELRERGLYFIGAMGILNGAPCTALAEPLDEGTILALSAAYVQYAGSIKAKPKGDFTEWASRLHALPDMRADA